MKSEQTNEKQKKTSENGKIKYTNTRNSSLIKGKTNKCNKSYKNVKGNNKLTNERKINKYNKR